MDVAILGSGVMGESVIKHLRECPQVGRIVAYDIRKERLEEMKSQYNVDITSDLNQVFGDSTIRLVFVTSSNDSHKALTIAALEAGKAVMCEKPMATTLADAEEMVNVAERTKGFLQIGFELRYSKLYTKVKDWIDQGLLGEVVNIHCLYCSTAYPKDAWRNKLSAGDTFPERLSHYVDLPAGGSVQKLMKYIPRAPPTSCHTPRSVTIITQLIASTAVQSVTFPTT